jgi:DNA-binding IclR family transcriptional regulator
VLDADGKVGGSIGISVPLYRFSPELEQACVQLVLREATVMTRDLGGDPGQLERAVR